MKKVIYVYADCVLETTRFPIMKASLLSTFLIFSFMSSVTYHSWDIDVSYWEEEPHWFVGGQRSYEVKISQTVNWYRYLKHRKTWYLKKDNFKGINLSATKHFLSVRNYQAFGLSGSLSVAFK